MRHRYVDMEWGQIHFAEAGDPDGELVVCLHQSPLSSTAFEQILDRMVAGSNRSVHVVAPDTPGYGRSDRASPDWGIVDYGRALALFVKALGRTSAMAVGHHTGAVIVVQAAADYPGLLTRLVLQGLPVYTDEERLDRLANFALSFKPKIDGSHLEFVWKRVSGMYPELDARGATQLVTDYLLAGPDYGRADRAVFSHNLQFALASVADSELPVTLLAGEHDLVVHHTTRVLELLPHAEQITVAGSGDFAPLEQPDEFVRHLNRVLELA